MGSTSSLISDLPDRHAIVRITGRKGAFVIKTADCDAVYPPATLGKHLAEMKQKIFATHPYYRTPRLTPQDHDQRLADFLQSVALPKPESPPPEKLEKSPLGM